MLIRAADHLIDLGSGAGVHGAEIVARGKPGEVARGIGAERARGVFTYFARFDLALITCQASMV